MFLFTRQHGLNTVFRVAFAQGFHLLQIGLCRRVTAGFNPLCSRLDKHHLPEFFAAGDFDTVPTFGLNHFQHILNRLRVLQRGFELAAFVFKQHGFTVGRRIKFAAYRVITGFKGVGDTVFQIHNRFFGLFRRHGRCLNIGLWVVWCFGSLVCVCRFLRWFILFRFVLIACTFHFLFAAVKFNAVGFCRYRGLGFRFHILLLFGGGVFLLWNMLFLPD